MKISKTQRQILEGLKKGWTLHVGWTRSGWWTDEGPVFGPYRLVADLYDHCDLNGRWHKISLRTIKSLDKAGLVAFSMDLDALTRKEGSRDGAVGTLTEQGRAAL
jgi:hypothetical protein